jgi:hypothetical protein
MTIGFDKTAMRKYAIMALTYGAAAGAVWWMYKPGHKAVDTIHYTELQSLDGSRTKTTKTVTTGWYRTKTAMFLYMFLVAIGFGIWVGSSDYTDTDRYNYLLPAGGKSRKIFISAILLAAVIITVYVLGRNARLYPGSSTVGTLLVSTLVPMAVILLGGVIMSWTTKDKSPLVPVNSS